MQSHSRKEKAKSDSMNVVLKMLNTTLREEKNAHFEMGQTNGHYL